MSGCLGGRIGGNGNSQPEEISGLSVNCNEVEESQELWEQIDNTIIQEGSEADELQIVIEQPVGNSLYFKVNGEPKNDGDSVSMGDQFEISEGDQIVAVVKDDDDGGCRIANGTATS